MRTRLAVQQCEMWRVNIILLFALYTAKALVDDDTPESGDHEFEEDFNETKNFTHTKSIDDREPEDSNEHIGASVTQVYKHPYAASLLKNDSYVCSAIVLNTYWILTLSKCFDTDVISSYVTYKHLAYYTVRVGSSYKNKGGSLSKIQMLTNNFELRISAVKLTAPLTFGARVQSVRLPGPDEDVALGHLAAMLAWTPIGHIRVVNAPVIDAGICETSTKLFPGHYICVGGVQDPNRNFCRKDNGGAVIQNNTLIAISTFLHTCALYTKTHAFPKASSFARWLDAIIWDEGNRPTQPTTETHPPTKPAENPEQDPISLSPDPRKFMLTLPFEPINVPIEPAEDNSVIPRISLYESYLQNMARMKTSTTQDPIALEQRKKDWMQKFGKAFMIMPPQIINERQNQFVY